MEMRRMTGLQDKLQGLGLEGSTCMLAYPIVSSLVLVNCLCSKAPKGSDTYVNLTRRHAKTHNKINGSMEIKCWKSKQLHASHLRKGFI